MDSIIQLERVNFLIIPDAESDFVKDIDIKGKDKYFLCLLRNCGKTHR